MQQQVYLQRQSGCDFYVTMVKIMQSWLQFRPWSIQHQLLVKIKAAAELTIVDIGDEAGSTSTVVEIEVAAGLRRGASSCFGRVIRSASILDLD